MRHHGDKGEAADRIRDIRYNQDHVHPCPSDPSKPCAGTLTFYYKKGRILPLTKVLLHFSQHGTQAVKEHFDELTKLVSDDI